MLLAKVCRNKFKKQGGWEVVVTSDYDLAISMLKYNAVSLLMTELVINDQQGRTGFDLVAVARKEYNDLIIAVFTELAHTSDKEKATSLGANKYFVKSKTTINGIIDEIKLLM